MQLKNVDAVVGDVVEGSNVALLTSQFRQLLVDTQRQAMC